MLRICNFISRWMALIVLVVAIGSLAFPSVFGVIKTSWISTLLGLVMFGMGLTISAHDFKVVFSRPKDIIIGCLAQFIIMPGLAFLLTKIFGLAPELAVGVILVGCCPGGTSSNVMTYLAGGDLALSVGMTGVSTIIAPFMTPFLVWLLAGTMVDVDMMAMFMSIVQVVILPIVIGLLVQKYIPKVKDSVLPYLPAFSTVAITLIVAAVVSANAGKLMTCGAIVIIVVILHNVCGYALGLGIGKVLKLTDKKSTAISIEVGMQNSGLACSLAQQHFATMALAPVPGAIFSVWHNISGALYAKTLSASSRHLPRNGEDSNTIE